MRQLSSLALLIAFAAAHTAPAAACSLCESVKPTVCDDIEPSEMAVFGRLVRSTDDDALFRIDSVLKGRENLGDVREARVVYFGDQPPGTHFLLIGNRVSEDTAGGPVEVIRWATPIEVTPRSIEYISRMWTLPKKGHQRLEFALPYVGDSEELLSSDAYDEFAKAPYTDIQPLKPLLHADQLVQRIRENEEPFSNLPSLFFTLLSVCGGSEQLPFLEELLQDPNVGRRKELNALIACYLNIAKENGLPLIEERFLISQRYDNITPASAAIAALRFQGQESNVIDRKQIVVVMMRMLERPQLGREIVSDLARWEVWDATDEVAAMFDLAAEHENSAYLRTPITSFMLACPLPEAAEHLERFESIDPEVVAIAHRAMLTSQATGDEQNPAVSTDATSDQIASSAAVEETSAAGSGLSDNADKTNIPERPRSALLSWQSWIVAAVAALVVVWFVGSRRRRPRDAVAT